LAGIDHRQPDAGALELVAQRLAEAALRGLGGAVDGGAWKGADAGARGHDHDVPAPAREHARERRLDGVDRPQPVHPGQLVDQLGRHLRERHVMGDAGVGHQHVHVAARLERPRDRLAVRHVPGGIAVARHAGDRAAA
jgi:hypothetical protein